MKKLILSLLVVSAFVAAPVSLFAQETANDNAEGKVTILSPISISNEAPLDFGAVALGSGNTGGSVFVPGTASPTASYDGVSAAAVSGAAVSAAEFLITGDNSNSFSLAYSGEDLVGEVLTLDGDLKINLESETEGSTLPTSATLSGTGTYSLYIGGTLTVPNSIDPDDYSSSFTVTVAYN